MNKNLIQKAGKATPPRDRHRSWKHYVPVVKKLRKKGFGWADCYRWLQLEAGEDEFPEEKEKSFTSSMIVMLRED